MSPSDTTHDELPDNLGYLLRLVRSELMRALEQELADQGVALRFSQFQALKQLQQSGPMCAGELARSLCHDGGATTRLLDQLESKGYLRRQPDPHDRRAVRIELTPEGSALCQQLGTCAHRVLDAAQISLSAQEQDQLLDYLQRILITLRQST